MSDKFVNIGLLAVVVVVSLFVADWFLALLGFAAQPRLSFAHPANVDENRENLEFQYVLRTNNRGLRYAEVPTEKPPGIKRVFVAGDSYTEGWGIDDGRRFTDLLESDAWFRGRVQFINGGLSGTGPLEYGRLFLSVGLAYRPDALLICVFVNDVTDTPEDLGDDHLGGPAPRRSRVKRIVRFTWPHVYRLLRRSWASWRYSRIAGPPEFVSAVTAVARERGVPEARIEKWQAALPPDLVAAVNQGRFNGTILSKSLLSPGHWRDAIDLESPRAWRKWENMARLLGQLLERARGEGVEVGVVLIPSQFQHDRASHGETNPWIVAGAEVDPSWLRDDTGIQQRFREWADAQDVAFLDLTPVFREGSARGLRLTWVLDGHWNTAGHELAAAAIAAWLCEAGVFSFVRC